MNAVEKATAIQGVIDRIEPNVIIEPNKYFTLTYLQHEFKEAEVGLSPSWWRAAVRSGRLVAGKINRTTMIEISEWERFVKAGGFYQNSRATRSKHEIQFAEGLAKLDLNTKKA